MSSEVRLEADFWGKVGSKMLDLAHQKNSDNRADLLASLPFNQDYLRAKGWLVDNILVQSFIQEIEWAPTIEEFLEKTKLQSTPQFPPLFYNALRETLKEMLTKY